MKPILFSLTLFTAVATAQAQTPEQGQQQLYYERYGTAEATFKQALQQNNTNAAAWQGLAEAHLAQNEPAEALTALQAAPAAVKEEPMYQVALGAALLHNNRKAEADPLFAQALDNTREKDANVLAAIAEAHISAPTGDVTYAIELLNKAIKRDKDNAALYVSLGDAYRKQLNGSEGYKAYKQALEKNDKYAAAYYRIGDIFLSQKNEEMYLDYFRKAVAADPNYAPALYRLYLYEFYHDAAKSMDYYNRYVANSDTSIQNEYDLTDLLYLNKQYKEALDKATALAKTEGETVQPRLYKLMGYSYAALNDSATAQTYMQQYFSAAPDSQVIARDYEMMSDLLAGTGQDSLAMVYLGHSVEKETDSLRRFANLKRLADAAKAGKDYTAQAKWLEQFYTGNNRATNLDLYYWGLAHYLAGQYPQADTVFGMYVAKYPEQSFGYYWQARSKALTDKDMTEGLAVPAYQKLIEVLEAAPTDPNYKKWMTEAYSYLAGYEANQEKDYREAVGYFEKVLEVDPANEDARKYISLLEKQIEK